MQTQAGVSFTAAIFHDDVVGLLKANPVPRVIPGEASTDHGPERAVKKNSAAAATVEGRVLLLVAFQDQVFDSGPLEVIPTDERKDGRGTGAIADHAIGIQGAADNKGGGARLADNPRDGGMKTVGVFIPDRHPITDREPFGFKESD